MNYVLQILAVLAFSIISAILIVLLVDKITNKKFKKAYKIIGGIIITIILLIADFLIYVNDYNNAKPEADSYLISSDDVTVEKTNFGYFFDGKGKNKAIIFYPGAKVETKAYAPLMFKLAENGIDTFLINMPFKLAMFGSNKADKVLKDYKYDEYYMMGHSLGGVVASSYLINHKLSFKGMIFLASYTTNKLDDDLNVLSFYGTNDGCLNMDSYNKNKINFPANFKEIVIEGGNHTQYALYPTQKDDKEATISFDKQQEIVISNIINII